MDCKPNPIPNPTSDLALNIGTNPMPNRKPIIALILLYDEKLDSYWMLPGYMKMLEQAGAVPIMLPLTQYA